MKTNLIFKKQVTVDGAIKTVTRIVPVEVPFINSGEGWILSGHSDEIEVVEHVCVSTITNNMPSAEEKPVDPIPALPEKFTSDVSGTAKLVRSKGVIKIVSRRGKSTYNQTTPNSICIHDTDKQEFFNQCRRFHGAASGLYEFTLSDGRPYEAWNKFIDEEYKRQQIRSVGVTK